MGNENTKLNYRKAVIQLTTKTQPVDAADDSFWSQYWSEYETTVQDIFVLIPAAEIRALREESPNNLATLCYKAVEQLVDIAEGSYPTYKEQQTALNCVRLLTRILPYIFEDPDWRSFFWSSLPNQVDAGGKNETVTENIPLAHTLLSAVSDLLFCPDFTVHSEKKNGPDKPEEIQNIDSCEYIWEAGVGFAHSTTPRADYDSHRAELLKLVLTCFSETIYLPPTEAHNTVNPWVVYFTGTENRHALPLFTSLLNVVCAYDPVGYGLPYNHLMFHDAREPLVEVALQVLCVTLEVDNFVNNETSVVSAPATSSRDLRGSRSSSADVEEEPSGPDNLFVNYMSRIHRDEDFQFILKGFTRLLNNPLTQTYLPGSTKKVQFHQELLILFWRMCGINKKFMFYVLKSSHMLQVLVPILYHLNDARSDQSRVGLMHIGVFILLLLSGERNFGVRLNKPYQVRLPMDIPVFTGTHSDLLIIVFHKIITTGNQRLQPLFECLLTIIVNISPYLKTLSMVSATKLLHLLEAFSTNWFLYANPTNHHLVFSLLEVFNNIIQYQFDGNSNLIYTIIRKRQVFHQLANLPTDHLSIAHALSKKGTSAAKKFSPSAANPTSSKPTQPTSPLYQPKNALEATAESKIDLTKKEGSLGDSPSMEGSRPAAEAEPGTLKASLEATPILQNITDCRPAHHPQEDGDLVNESVTSTPTTITISKLNPSLNITARNYGESPTPSATSSTIHSLSTAAATNNGMWVASPEWVQSWKQKLPLQTIMRLLQVLVPQVEKICIDKGLTDESEILKFLQHGTLVGLLPVPHPILIRKYQSNSGTSMWLRTYMWGVIYLRNMDPPIWYDTDVRLFEIQRV